MAWGFSLDEKADTEGAKINVCRENTRRMIEKTGMPQIEYFDRAASAVDICEREPRIAEYLRIDNCFPTG
jgi:hypothetical protein